MPLQWYFLFCRLLSTDGDILCDGHAAGAAWTPWTLYCVFVQCSSKVSHFPRYFSVLLVFFLTCTAFSHDLNTTSTFNPMSLTLAVYQPAQSNIRVLVVTVSILFWLFSLQHHLFCFQLSGHRDDGRPHQTTFSRHDRVQSNHAVQGLRFGSGKRLKIHDECVLKAHCRGFPCVSSASDVLRAAVSGHVLSDPPDGRLRSTGELTAGVVEEPHFFPRGPV